LQERLLMNRFHAVLFHIVAILMAAFAALCATVVLAQTTTSDGLLRDKAGKTLYTFDKDAAGESRCFDGCAAAWPPFMTAEGAKAKDRLTLAARKGGGMQWAFDGKPLYYFAGDAKPGDVAGDGSGGVWHVVRLAASGDTRAQTAQPQADPYKY
jgi:predicted lipoprotein with Yx(FWY)xxD motif